jgi:hypothetical protein
MESELNALGYSFNAKNYTAEFQRILCGLFTCYTILLKNETVFPNDENKIRDTLLIRCLHNDEIRELTGLSGNFIFDREVPEDNTPGRTDIKVQTLHSFIKSDAYYIIECKRLDNNRTTGLSGLNAEYINNGIYRFVSKQYSIYHRINAMIGFIVEKLDISENIQKINTLLKKPQMRNCNTTREIQTVNFIPNFDFHYSSEHNDCDNESFILYHLMFDLSDNMQNEFSESREK